MLSHSLNVLKQKKNKTQVEKHSYSESCQTVLSSLCLLFNLSQSLHQLHGLTGNLLCFLLSVFSLFFLTLEQSPDRRIVHKYIWKKKTVSPDSSFLKQREHTVNCKKKKAFIISCLIYLSICLLFFSSLAWAFICCTSMVSGLRLRMYRSWFPIHKARIRLFMRRRGT